MHPTPWTGLPFPIRNTTPLRYSWKFNKHILYQILIAYNLLFFKSFLRIPCCEVPNFVAEFGQMVKNWPNLSLKTIVKNRKLLSKEWKTRSILSRRLPLRKAFSLMGPLFFVRANSSILRTGTVHLQDRSTLLESKRAPYHKNQARILSCRERSGHVPRPSQRVLTPSPNKP